MTRVLTTLETPDKIELLLSYCSCEPCNPEACTIKSRRHFNYLQWKWKGPGPQQSDLRFEGHHPAANVEGHHPAAKRHHATATAEVLHRERSRGFTERECLNFLPETSSTVTSNF